MRSGIVAAGVILVILGFFMKNMGIIQIATTPVMIEIPLFSTKVKVGEAPTYLALSGIADLVFLLGLLLALAGLLLRS